MKEKLLISKCIIGENCKYNGLNNYNEKVELLKNFYELISVCPEVDGGLKTPRVPSEILNDKVINKENEDNTPFFNKGAEIALKICLEQNITKALLKQKSPSCGSKQIYDGTFTNTIINGEGITSKLLRQNNITIYDENDIETLIELAKNK